MSAMCWDHFILVDGNGISCNDRNKKPRQNALPGLLLDKRLVMMERIIDRMPPLGSKGR